MRRFILAATTAATVMSAVSSCKTTEANYREAYEATVAHRDSRIDVEFDRSTEVSTDSSVVRTVFLLPVKSDKDADIVTPDKALPFNAAVNKFKQVFNARALCRRLRDNGWPKAYIARTPDDEFYVMAGGALTQAEAADICTKLRKMAKTVPLGRGYPTIVKSAR